MATAEAVRRASANRARKLREAGLRQVTVWLPADAMGKLDRLGVVWGSKDRAIAAALLAMHAPALKLGDRVIWKGRRGYVRHGLRTVGEVEEVDIRFDDASDDAFEWRLVSEVEPE